MKIPADAIAILTADWHLDEAAWADRPELSGDSREAFRWIVDLAVEHDLPILAAGDLLDKPKNESAPIHFMRAQLERLTNQLFFIQGQKTHDQSDPPWFTVASDRAVWLDPAGGRGPQQLGDSWVWVSGLDWRPPELVLPQFQAAWDALEPRPQVFLMHQVTSELMGTVRTPEVSAAALSGPRVLVMGDYHRHLSKRITGADGRQFLLASPGSTNLRSIDEPEDKCVFILRADLSVQSLRIPTRPVLRYDVTTSEALDEFVYQISAHLADVSAAHADLPEAIRQPIVRVRFAAALPDAYPRIRQAVGPAAHLFTKVLEEPARIFVTGEEEADSEELVDRITSEGALACLEEFVTEAEDPHVFQLCRALVSDADPRAALAAARSKFVGEDI